MIYGIETTTHGNYICPFHGTRKVMKTQNGIIAHIENDHAIEARIWNIERNKKNAEQRAQAAEEKLKIYTEEQKKKPKTEYYNATVYCTTCRKLADCGMPKGVLPSNVTCPNCGVSTLNLVVNVSYWRS